MSNTHPHTNVELDIATEEKNPIYYMWIGDSIDELDKKNIRFVIQVKNYPEHRSVFAGVVVAVSPKTPASVTVGHTSKSWSNPVDDSIAGFSPSFIRVPARYVESKFPNFKK